MSIRDISLPGVILAAALLSVGVHLALGWSWTLAAGVPAGALKPARWFVAGSLSGAVGWALPILYSLGIAPAPTLRMADTMGNMLGGAPGIVFIAATVLTGAWLGALGAAIGAGAKRLLPIRSSKSAYALQNNMAKSS